MNSVGVMGKGIALQFKNAFPENFKAYVKACEEEQVAPGRMFVHDMGELYRPRYIINFPTKRHWKGKSKLKDIESGLVALLDVVRSRGIRSLAVPPLGCGNGALDWEVVHPLIERAFERLPEVRVLLFPPTSAPDPEKMKTRTRRPKMTAGRSAVLGLMSRYVLPGYKMTLLEVQKLVYFLKESGEPLEKLDFVKHMYGPYCDTLRHVLGRMDGHFITGWGDGSGGPDVPIRLLESAAEEAERYLEGHEETCHRFVRVVDLIEGFETPYGMELLATTHWVATREDSSAKTNPEAAVAGIHAWSDKKKKFKPEHIKVAWARLHEMGWLEGSSLDLKQA